MKQLITFQCLIGISLLSVSCLTPQSQLPPPAGDQFILRLVTDRALAPLMELARFLPRHGDATIITSPQGASGEVVVEYRLANLRRHAAQQLLGELLSLKSREPESSIVVTLSLSIVRSSLNLAATPLLPPTRPSNREEFYLYYGWILRGQWSKAELRRILEGTSIEIIVIPPGSHRSSPASFQRSIPFVEFVLSDSRWRYEVPIGRAGERS